MIKYLSLFSGIGGFEVGLSNSHYDFECVGASEVDKNAISIYSRHFPTHKQWGDVKEIKTEELPDFDFLVGGFPCQSFSNAGAKRGFDDTRGTLFFEIARILKDKRPSYFLLENVKGLLYNNNGKTFKRILGVLTSLGYNVQWEILNSQSFRIPQRRERVFIKGFFRGKSQFKVQYLKGYPKKNDVSITDDNIKIKTDTKKGYKNAGVGDGVRLDRLDQKRGGRGRVQYDAVGTLMCSCNWGVVDKNLQIRKLTPLEYERLQGFPDNYSKYGNNGELISENQRYKCLGNAVTTDIITFIVNNMFGG